MTGLFVGTPITQLPVASTLTDTASVIVIDNGAKLATLSLLGDTIGGGAIINAPLISPVYLNDYTVIVRDGVIYLALVSDVLGAVTPIGPPPENPYVTEDMVAYYVAEDGTTYYEYASSGIGTTGQSMGLLMAITYAS